jgi:hypothetical protein
MYSAACKETSQLHPITASSGGVIQCALAILEIGDLFVDIAGLPDLGAVEPTFRF